MIPATSPFRRLPGPLLSLFVGLLILVAGLQAREPWQEDWSEAGVQPWPSAVPTVIDVTATGIVAEAEADNSPALQRLIAGLRGEAVLYFPPGEYGFASPVEITTEHPVRRLIIRGAGPEATVLRFAVGEIGWGGLLLVAGTPETPAIAVTTPVARGDDRLAVVATAPFRVGDWIALRQDNVPAEMPTKLRRSGMPERYLETIDNAEGWAARTIGQIFRVTRVEDEAVRVTPAARLDYTWPNLTVQRLDMRTGVGFEDFTLMNTNERDGLFSFRFEHAANCWIENVHSFQTVRAHVALTLAAHIEIAHSLFWGSHRHGGGGHGYGVMAGTIVSDCLVVDNLFSRLRHALMVKQGASGNVYAFNYSFANWWPAGSTEVPKDISGHGHFPFANLFEGNVVQHIHGSDFWGPVGPRNVYFRNLVTGPRIRIEDHSHEQVVVGNVLLRDEAVISIDETSRDPVVYANRIGETPVEDNAEAVAASLWREQPPAWWPAEVVWPAVDPARAPAANTNPARARWQAGEVRFAPGFPPADPFTPIVTDQ